MFLRKIAGLSLAAAATFAIGVSPALAQPHHPQPHNSHRSAKPHKVCKTEWHHGHKARTCHWVR
ncbi:MAG TPA: hypothetical protein VF475_08755 [Sphingobium sp.]